MPVEQRRFARQRRTACIRRRPQQTTEAITGALVVDNHGSDGPASRSPKAKRQPVNLAAGGDNRSEQTIPVNNTPGLVPRIAAPPRAGSRTLTVTIVVLDVHLSAGSRARVGARDRSGWWVICAPFGCVVGRFGRGLHVEGGTSGNRCRTDSRVGLTPFSASRSRLYMSGPASNIENMGPLSRRSDLRFESASGALGQRHLTPTPARTTRPSPADQLAPGCCPCRRPLRGHG